MVTLDDEMHRQASWSPELSENYGMINELKNSWFLIVFHVSKGYPNIFSRIVLGSLSWKKAFYLSLQNIIQPFPEPYGLSVGPYHWRVLRMIELILNYFPFLTGFPSRMHARQAAVLALTLLLILTLVTATQAKEEGDILD